MQEKPSEVYTLLLHFVYNYKIENKSSYVVFNDYMIVVLMWCIVHKVLLPLH